MVSTGHPNRELEEKILIPDSETKTESPLTPLKGEVAGTPAGQNPKPEINSLVGGIAPEDIHDGTAEGGEGLRLNAAVGMV